MRPTGGLPHHLIRNYMRYPLVVRTTHQDWEFSLTSQMAGADERIQNWRVDSGEIKTLDSKMTQPGCHWFIKALRPDTIQRLERVNWREVAYPRSPTPRLP